MRKTPFVLAALLAVAGICVMLWPVFTGHRLQADTDEAVQNFLEERKPEQQYPELLAALQEYNRQLYTEKQCNLTDLEACEEPAADLTAYGIEDEIIGALAIPAMPAFDVEALFSAGRSRGITLVPIIQSLAQLEKNYGREGAEILTDNCQDTIFGGFAPNSQTAEQLSKSLGSRTVLSGSVSKGKNDPSQSLQMIERPLMTPDELKSIPKGSFVVMKTGTHPMQTKLRLFLDWGITFGEPYATPEHAARPVAYASRQELFLSISKRYSSSDRPVQAQQASATQRRTPRSAMGLYSEDTRP